MASFTLFDLHVNAHEKVGTITYGETTASGSDGASTNHATVMDETFSSAHADDQFNGGTIYFVRSGDQGSTSIFVEKRYRRILDYDASSGQYTFAPVTTASTAGLSTGRIATDTLYGVATPEFTLSLTDRLSKAALRTLGPFVYTDRSLQSSANQTVYQLTTLATRSKPFRIDLQGRTESSQDNPSWVQLYGWYVEPSTVAAGWRIVFPRSLPANRDIRIFYEDDHIDLAASTAVIDGRIHPELATLALVEKMYEYRNSRARGAQEFDVQRWNDAKRQLAEARVRWPIWRPKKGPQILVIGGQQGSGGVQAPPYGAID